MGYTQLLTQYLVQIDSAMFAVPAVILNTRVIPMQMAHGRPVITVYGKSAIPPLLAKHLKFLDQVEDNHMIYLILSDLLDSRFASVNSDEAIWGLAALTVWERIMMYAALSGKHDLESQATSHRFIAKAAEGIGNIIFLDPKKIKEDLWREYDHLLATPGWIEHFKQFVGKRLKDYEQISNVCSALIWERAEINTIITLCGKHFTEKKDQLEFMIRCKDALFKNVER
jgi:hypothetical protein